MRTVSIIISILCIACLFLIHNIDNAFNMVKNERDLCKSGIIADTVDCNPVTCFKAEKLYLFSVITLTSIISTIIVLKQLFD
jgi:hypothetical protein